MLTVGTRIRYQSLDGKTIEGVIVEADVFDKDAYFYKIQDEGKPALCLYFYKKAIDDAIKSGEIEILGNAMQKMKKRLQRNASKTKSVV